MEDSRPKPLKDQTALVTGSSSGIGAAIARKLAQHGAAVCINYRTSADRADEVVRSIVTEGGHAFAVCADTSDESAVERLFAECVARFGRVDIVVANAGIQRDAALEQMTLEQWRAVIDVNLTGYFLSAREALRLFAKQEINPALSRAAGKIIFISSVHELIPWAGHANYAAAKGGIMQLTKSMAQEVAPRRIRVNAIAPGAIRTDINRQAWEDPDALNRLLKLIPYNRIGEVDDVAEAAAWLASDAADYVVGTTLFVDGGMTLYPAFASGG
ncbi:glucose 1-dehydrogenase [Paraburkholderia fungorum]|jgi:glucose 1-dehydrogenase|uniref:Glucose 1-dehydrogenase n=1 Tax=Paraburkholderia fungorum TaxID=134537 RepID=A0AAP5Q320_9BURK|nr:glucose 1-dehydrogenase [Paraburkholderia fungorum]MDT8835839.1 glucose 1-dehydrogenase [Paraburkholderia fungorum]